MRRRAVVAIVGAFVAIAALTAAWVVFSTDFFTVSQGNLRSGTQTYRGEQLAPPPTPQSGLDLATGQAVVPDPGGAASSAAIEAHWQDVREAAAVNKWAAWAYMIDADTGQVLLDDASSVGHAPASTLKVLTTLAVLGELDQSATLSTGTSLDGSTVYLWGEGDLLLGTEATDEVAGRANLAQLASETADELADRDVASVELRYQDSLFDGANRLPDWTKQEVTDYAGDVGPFAIDTGRVAPGVWAFVDDSALDVAEVFADLLRAEGVEVSDPAPGTAPLETEQLASIESAPLGEQIGEMIRASDNTMAEQFCHLAAAEAGNATDFSSVTKFLTQYVADLGIDTDGLRIDDCSGLSGASRVTARQLVQALQASVAEGSHATSLIRMLPRAGLDGTMQDRFYEAYAIGNVQAKTGSLMRASTLAGVLTTSGGQTLLFAIGVDDGEKVNAYYARDFLDTFLEQVIDEPA